MTYDITDKKRLKRVAKLLKRYGHRVQKSVFACDINERRRRELEAKLRTEKQDGDSIRIYEYRADATKEIEGTSQENGKKTESARTARCTKNASPGKLAAPVPEKKDGKTFEKRWKKTFGCASME